MYNSKLLSACSSSSTVVFVHRVLFPTFLSGNFALQIALFLCRFNLKDLLKRHREDDCLLCICSWQQLNNLSPKRYGLTCSVLLQSNTR
jgi:hypothetical protein